MQIDERRNRSNAQPPNAQRGTAAVDAALAGKPLTASVQHATMELRSLSQVVSHDTFSLGKEISNDGAGDDEAFNKALTSALPHFGVGLTVTIILEFVVNAVFNLAPVGVARDLWVHLPMQLYWTFCLVRICDGLRWKYGNTAAPLPTWAIGAVSLVSFLCAPNFSPYNYISRLLDPVFYAWLASQLVFPIAAGAFIEKRDEPGCKFPWKIPAVLATATNAYLFAVFTLPEYAQAGVFNLFWLVSQFSILIFISMKLQGKFESTKRKEVRPEEKDMLQLGDQLIVRYRAFAEAERWFKQRFTEESMKHGARGIMMWFIGPVLIILSLSGLSALMSSPVMHTTTAAPTVATAAGAAAHAAGGGNLSIIMGFVLSLFGAGAVGACVFASKPTHLAIGADGIRWLWRHNFNKRIGPATQWSQLQHIAIRRPPGKTSPMDDVLSFESANARQTIKVNMNSIDSVQAKEAILHAINKYAADVSRDANVMEALQPPADYSYTELWLQALSAPPKRERLKPLIEGASLRDGTYRVKGSLGVGGQGQAYLALDKSHNDRRVVLKEFILPVFVDVSVRRTALEQFENEARILRQLNHPQIVQLIDFFIEDHRAYLVLELIDGVSLRQIVDSKGPLPEHQVRMLADQMCDILGYLHGLAPPVVHRDFTPDNLILDKNGRLKLIDFNVAKQVESTTVGTVVGKHAYLPPEQFRGMPVPQSDIYAMGCTLHYLLTGADPQPISMSDPRKQASHVSESLSAVVRHATALDLAKRYPTIQHLAQYLHSLQPG